MDEISKAEIAQYREQLQSEIDKALVATTSELYRLDCETWREANLEKFFTIFPVTKKFTDMIRKLFSAPDCRYGMEFSDAEYLQGLVNQDTVLMLLEEVIVKSFDKKKSFIKKLKRQYLCENVESNKLFHEFCDFFHCNEKEREILLYQLYEVVIIKEALPIYLFFAYLQIDKHKNQNKTGKFLDDNIVKMQSLDTKFLQAGTQFMDFLFEWKEQVNYPLNLYLLNRYLLVPDTIYFCEYPKEKMKLINNVLKEDKGISLDFINYDEEAVKNRESDWVYSTAFTVLRPMICKWYLYSLWPNSDCNLFKVDGGCKAIAHILTCAEKELWIDLEKKDSKSFGNIFDQLCQLSRKCNIPITSTFSDALDESHKRFYKEVREYYKVYRPTDTTFPTDGR